MDKRAHHALLLGVIGAICGVGLYLALNRPGLVGDGSYLAGLIFLQILIACLWKFRQTYFAFLLLVFIWAGLKAPASEAMAAGRWVVLAAGAGTGFVLWLQERRYHLHILHLLAFLCVLVAFISAGVSSLPNVSYLKAGSLFLLFLYASAGARFAILGREEAFFRGLLLGCEITVYFTAILYMAGIQFWGNPNSLGLVMGVVAGPLLTWGVLETDRKGLRQRRSFALMIAIGLLFMSMSRASIVAGVSSVALMFPLLRGRKWLLGVAFLTLTAVATWGIFTPDKLPILSDAFVHRFYKGHPHAGPMGSRTGPWRATFDSIAQHPYFGTGFGTTASGDEAQDTPKYASNEIVNREHGSSYLEIVEWVGYVGLVPFAGMVLALLLKISRTCAFLRRHGNPRNVLVPIVMLLLAGLVHAVFEDWMFAAGYYLTVLYWPFAFVLFDLLPQQAEALPCNRQTLAALRITDPGLAGAYRYRDAYLH